MKKNKQIFEGAQSALCPEDWDSRIGDDFFMNSKLLAAARHSNTPFAYVSHPQYICCENKTKLNIFTYGKARVDVPVTVMGMPVSLDRAGYCGNLAALAADYRARKGICLLLNLPSLKDIPPDAVTGETLGTCVFTNRFTSFEHYVASLRSSYRRRVTRALQAGKPLAVKKIGPHEYTDEIHQLYLNVLQHSKYPLEILDKEFFQELGGEIHVFYHQQKPLAFICTYQHNSCLHFIFGGMDYARRDEFDLYYTMLLTIIQLGIQRGCTTINFGQTAESTKCRLGCHIEKRYMAVFCSSKILHAAFKRFAPLLEYRYHNPGYRVFK